MADLKAWHLSTSSIVKYFPLKMELNWIFFLSADMMYPVCVWFKNVYFFTIKNSASDGWIISRLSILSAERQHSGIYACSIINSTSATVDVQILTGR